MDGWGVWKIGATISTKHSQYTKHVLFSAGFFFTYDFNFELIEIENVLLDIAPKTAHNQHNN